MSFTAPLFAQVIRPSAVNVSESHLIRVFQDDGVEVLSVDVSNSNVAVYSGTNLTIAGTSRTLIATRTYYLLADKGAYVCAYVCACVCG